MFKIIIEQFMNSRQNMGNRKEMDVTDIYNMHVQTSQITFFFKKIAYKFNFF